MKILGNLPVSEPLNVQREVARFRCDPLDPLLTKLGEPLVIHGAAGRYYRTYDFYVLCLERALQHISVGRRFQGSVRPNYGGRRRLSNRQKEISRRYREQRPFFELDFMNYVLHARILLDRVVALSRAFLNGPNLPSFSSFSDHKKFLQRNPIDPRDREYREHFVGKTEWFEVLKDVRDKFVVHSSPKHFLMMLYPSHHDLQLAWLPVDRNGKAFGQAAMLRFSVRRLGRDIDSFLNSYANYALGRVNGGKTSGKGDHSSS